MNTLRPTYFYDKFIRCSVQVHTAYALNYSWILRSQLMLIILWFKVSLNTSILWFDLMYGHFSIIVDCCNSSLLVELSFGTLGWTGERWCWYSIKIRFFEWFARCIFRFETGVYVRLILIKKYCVVWCNFIEWK